MNVAKLIQSTASNVNAWLTSHLRLLLLLTLTYGLISSFAYASQQDLQEGEIALGIFIENITDINEKKEVIDMSLIASAQWIDKAMGEMVKAEGLSTKKYRIETFRSINAAAPAMNFVGQRKAPYFGSSRVIVNDDGLIDLSVYVIVSLDVPMNIRKFPFDDQTLKIRLRMLRDHVEDYTLFVKDDFTGVSKQASMEGWRIIDHSSEVENFTNTGGQELLEYVFTFNLERKSEYYLFKVFFPFFIIMILANCVFWLRKQPAVNLVSVVLVILLTIVAFQWSVTDAMPKVSYMTYLLSIILFSYLYVASIIPTIVIQNNLSEQKADTFIKYCRWIYPILYVLGIILLSIYFL